MAGDMTRRTFVASSAGAAAAVYLGGCGGTRAPGARTVRLAGNGFGFPSPFAYIAGPGYVQMSYLYDTLVWKDASGRIIPWLATRFERSRDGLTYTFELRRGVAWHDGRPVTAADVAFTFSYFARQSLGPLLVAQAFGVKGARATGSHTVEVVLEIPAVTFLESVAGALPIIPKHVWSTIRDAPRAQDPRVLVGSGPYRLASFSPGEGASLYLANRRYFLGPPFIRRIELRPVDDELSALRAGEIDVADTPAEGVARDALATFASDPAFGMVQAAGSFTFPLIWNIGRGGALADVRFRRACALAIDRQAMVDRVLGGNGQPGNPGFLPPGNPFHVPVEQYGFDRRTAERLLDQAGYRRSSTDGPRHGPDGRPLRFRIVTGNAPVPPVLDLLVGGLKAVGVQLSPQAVDLPTLFGLTRQGSDDIALTLYPGPGGTAPDGDPDTLRTFYSSQIKERLQGAQGYRNPEFDRLAGEQLVAHGEGERRRIIARMQHLVARDLPALPLYYPNLYNVFRKRAFDRWYYTPGGVASGVPTVFNKQVLVTGNRTGLRIRGQPPTRGALIPAVTELAWPARPGSPGRRRA
ncbi:MAG: ABC transporter substrate-binding protein [Actinomycetota bacterium]|nr:ABC transporter substrate-binding protein [Actinomycetota bacterium]